MLFKKRLNIIHNLKSAQYIIIFILIIILSVRSVMARNYHHIDPPSPSDPSVRVVDPYKDSVNLRYRTKLFAINNIKNVMPGFFAQILENKYSQNKQYDLSKINWEFDLGCETPEIILYFVKVSHEKMQSQTAVAILNKSTSSYLAMPEYRFGHSLWNMDPRTRSHTIISCINVLISAGEITDLKHKQTWAIYFNNQYWGSILELEKNLNNNQSDPTNEKATTLVDIIGSKYISKVSIRRSIGNSSSMVAEFEMQPGETKHMELKLGKYIISYFSFQKVLNILDEHKISNVFIDGSMGIDIAPGKNNKIQIPTPNKLYVVEFKINPKFGKFCINNKIVSVTPRKFIVLLMPPETYWLSYNQRSGPPYNSIVVDRDMTFNAADESMVDEGPGEPDDF